MCKCLSVNYIKDGYNNIFGILKAFNWNLMFASMCDSTDSFFSIATAHAVRLMEKLGEIDVSDLTYKYHIYADSIGSKDPLTWSCAMASYCYKGDFEPDKSPTEILYCSNESNTRLQLKCIIDAINMIPRNNYPIIIHINDDKLFNLIEPSKCLEHAANEWETSDGLPVECYLELRNYLRALDGRIVCVSNGYENKDTHLLLKKSILKECNSTSTVCIKSF